MPYYCKPCQSQIMLAYWPCPWYYRCVGMSYSVRHCLYQLGEFGCVYKAMWTHTTASKEKVSDTVAVKTVKGMQESNLLHNTLHECVKFLN